VKGDIQEPSAAADENASFRPELLPVGRYLTDQPMVFCQVVLHRHLVERAGELAAKRTASGRSSLRTIPNDPIPIPLHEKPPNLWFPCSENRRWHCQISRDAFSYGAVPPNIDERLVVDLRWFGANTPVWENRVEFEEDVHDR
jgi:pyranose oxidase